MTDVDWNFATLDDALRASRRDGGQPEERLAPLQSPNWSTRQRRVFRSVFQTDITQPTPNATPATGFPAQGQSFGRPVAAAAGAASFPLSQRSDDLELPDAGDEDDDQQLGKSGQAHRQDVRGPDSANAFSQLPLSAYAQGPAAAAGRATSAMTASSAPAADDQLRYDRAWHIVTARIALPSSVAVEDSFGTLAPESQLLTQDAATESEFQDALYLVLRAPSVVPRAAHTDDILVWHTHQVRRHYAQHVLPMLSACVDVPAPAPPNNARYYDHHMTVVLNSVRTLEAAFRLYSYGLMLIVRGFPPSHSDGARRHEAPLLPAASTVVSRFRQDVHALVARSSSPNLTLSIRAVFTRFASVILGFERGELRGAAKGRPGRDRVSQGTPFAASARKTQQPQNEALPSAQAPKPPVENDAHVQTLRQQMHELLESLSNVGLAGENFQNLFAEIMDAKMIEFIQLSFAGCWANTPIFGLGKDAADNSRPERAKSRSSRSQLSVSPSIAALYDWIENHFARLAHEVMGHIGKGIQDTISFSDVRKWKDVGLGRLSALRMTELFDIVLHWPLSRGGLEDLRVSVTTPQRRSQLVSTFTADMRSRLLHPACSTLEILQTYIAMIRTFHVLDPSNVLLSAAVGSLQLYLCQRDDAVRIVVDGLLADTEEATATGQPAATVAERIARSRSSAAVFSSSNGKLVELAAILNDPSQQRRRHIDEEELDWNDMDWVPDPIDAGTNYRRPKSEDVIGTLISALGSREAFTKEFQNIIAERLLSSQVVFAKEVKVLNLLKKRFGEGSLQNCEVMIRDIQDSNRLNAIIHQLLQQQDSLRTWTHQNGQHEGSPSWSADLQYQAKILSRLYWPGLDREHFLLPTPVATMQARYEAGYEDRKSSRKLAWLNQLGQASVELDLSDRTVAVECKTYEAAVIYAFQDPADDDGGNEGSAAARRTISQLVDTLQMDDDLVASALLFWQKQGVLRQEPTHPETYVVIESLADAAEAGPGAATEEFSDQPEDGSATTVAAAVPAAAPPRARQARGDDAQRTVYWQFIVGMLTNSAASMPLAQIAMMLKMLMAGGFPWSDEELQELLAEKVADGELEITAGKYRLVKK